MDTIQQIEIQFGQDPKLKSFFEFAAKLPPAFEWTKVTAKKTSPKTVKRLRKKFGQPSKTRTRYRYFAEKYGDELLEMGVSFYQLDRMLDPGIRPKSIRGETLDISFDHMHSLFLGGNNDLDNLCLVPNIYNHFKNVLEKLQYRESPRLTEILTIMPVYHTETRRRWGVPLIKGGFQERISNKGMTYESH
ncbi:MAG: hypothetical protein AAGB32_00275 [Pseudomonadota bacterium]